MKSQIRELAAMKLQVDPKDIEVGKGGFWLQDEPQKLFPMSHLTLANHPEARGTLKPRHAWKNLRASEARASSGVIQARKTRRPVKESTSPSATRTAHRRRR